MKVITLALMASALLVGCAGGSEETTEQEKKPVKKEVKKTKKEEVAPARIAWVQLDSVQNNYEYYKDAQKAIKARQESAESSINQKGKNFATQYQSLQQRAQSGELTKEQYEKEALRLQQLQSELETLQTKLGTQLQNEAEKRQRALVDTIRAQIKSYAIARGYDYVLCQSSEIDNVLYACDKYDITDEVIAVLNKHYSKDEKKKK